MGGAIAALNPMLAIQGAAISGGSGGGLGDIFGTGSLDGARSDFDNATKQANDYLQKAYGQQEGFAQPYMDAGKAGIAGLQNFNFQQDPGYQFRLNQGLGGINSALGQRGLRNSGAALKALSDYNQNFASNEYNNAYNRNYQTNMGLANFGQNAYQNMGGWAGQRGAGEAQNMMNLGANNAQYNIARGNKATDLFNGAAKGIGSIVGMFGGF